MSEHCHNCGCPLTPDQPLEILTVTFVDGAPVIPRMVDAEPVNLDRYAAFQCPAIGGGFVLVGREVFLESFMPTRRLLQHSGKAAPHHQFN